MKNYGTLYLVATPLGNLGDITFRAAEKLLSAPYIACEDTRRTFLFLAKLRELYPFLVKDEEYEKPILISYYNEVETQKSGELLAVLKQGKDIVLISDAGSPLVSDPGYVLVREAVKNGVKVDSFPGPSAVINALQISGFAPNNFFFLGFLPDKVNNKKETLHDLKETLEKIKDTKISVPTVIFYEAPHRLLSSLRLLKDQFGDINIAVCRELTKIHQDVIRNNISFNIAYFEKNRPLGEFSVVFNIKS
jgi:16S rRNA (cytidine1402-2'-O)-methyltransferase